MLTDQSGCVDDRGLVHRRAFLKRLVHCGAVLDMRMVHCGVLDKGMFH